VKNMSIPTVVKMEVFPVAGHDCMELNLSGAHAPYFTRNVVILTDSTGAEGVGLEAGLIVPADEPGGDGLQRLRAAEAEGPGAHRVQPGRRDGEAQRLRLPLRRGHGGEGDGARPDAPAPHLLQIQQQKRLHGGEAEDVGGLAGDEDVPDAVALHAEAEDRAEKVPMTGRAEPGGAGHGAQVLRRVEGVLLQPVRQEKGRPALRAGDVLSLRGRGKCELTSLGAEQTRKGRLFVTAEVYK